MAVNLEQIREELIAQVARTVGAFEASSTKNRPSMTAADVLARLAQPATVRVYRPQGRPLVVSSRPISTNHQTLRGVGIYQAGRRVGVIVPHDTALAALTQYEPFTRLEELPEPPALNY
jgi:hypothetical protein